MAKHPRIPRVSIIVPFQRDEPTFEETLLSVLENQPAGCEVIVPHNGTYSDPFDLEGEVQFAVARSSNLVDLIRDGFQHTTAQFVHVVASGIIASEDWISQGLEAFENGRVAAVAPTLAYVGKESVADAGWVNTPGRLCVPNVSDRGDWIDGCYLHACFFRRQILGRLLESVAPAMVDSVAVAYALGCLLKRGGWKVAPSRKSLLTRTPSLRFVDESDNERGKSLAAIHASVLEAAPGLKLTAMLGESVFGSGSLGELVGSYQAKSLIATMNRSIDVGKMPVYDTASNVLRMPETHHADRNAA